MPAKNALKSYSENTYYHLYNRGVEKRQIFEDGQDYAVFLSYLKSYLLPKDEEKIKKILTNPLTSSKEKYLAANLLRLNNFSDEITLLAYCLMPNHFHLLVKQKSRTSINNFMRSLGTRYTLFFNKKHRRVGTLCQAVYKGVAVETDEQLLFLSSYIHRNPLGEKFFPKEKIRAKLNSQPSSLPEYLSERKTGWIHPEKILAHFSKKNPKLDYQTFVEQTEEIEEIIPLQNHLIDF